MEIRFQEYSEEYKQQVISFILDIQRNEFGLTISAKDQPDLSIIKAIYQEGNGNFWIAIDEDKVIGTIALIDIGENRVALRKMFVAQAYRGREKAVAQTLFNLLSQWCMQKQVKEIWLGTIDIMKAAHKFYEKNGFSKVEKTELPLSFPVMPVDNLFYKSILPV